MLVNLNGTWISLDEVDSKLICPACGMVHNDNTECTFGDDTIDPKAYEMGIYPNRATWQDLINAIAANL